MLRLSPDFCGTCLPGFATVPLTDRVMAFVFRFSITMVCAVSASVRLIWCVALSRRRCRLRCSLET
jgi:hypothetical protein